MQAIACSACICVGVHRITASTSSRSSASASSVPECGAPYFGGHFGGLLGAARDDRGDLDAVDVLQAVEVLFAERAGAGEGNAHV